MSGGCLLFKRSVTGVVLVVVVIMNVVFGARSRCRGANDAQGGLPWDSLSLFVSASKSKVNGFPRSERPILDP